MMLMHEVKVQLLPYSQHKFASNVVEKCLQYGTREERGVLIQHLTHGHAEGQASLLQVTLTSYDYCPAILLLLTC
jgi:Pumilio-family RNA binding repeat